MGRLGYELRLCVAQCLIRLAYHATPAGADRAALAVGILAWSMARQRADAP